MSKVNQKKSGVILTYLTQTVKILTGLIYTPIMLSIVGQSEYGLYEISESIISYLVLINLGFLGAYARYYTVAQQKSKKETDNINGVFLIVLLIMSAICVIAGVTLVSNVELLFGSGLTVDEYALSKKLMGILIVNMAISFPAGLFEHNITVNEHFFIIKIIELLKQLLNPFIALPLLLLGYGSFGLVITTTFITITASIIEIIYCKTKLDMGFALSENPMPILRNIGKFSFFILLNQIIDLINWNIDKVIIGRYMGSVAVAIYSVGGQLRRMFSTFPNAIRTVYQPQMYKMVAFRKSKESISQLFANVGRIQCLILLPMLIGFVCLGKQFINLWTGEEYIEAYYVAICIMVPISIPHMQDIGIDLQRAMNKHQARSVVYASIAIVNILLTIPLVRIYGIIGASFATGISLLAGNGIFMNFYYKKALGVDIKIFWNKILRIIIPEALIGVGFFFICRWLIIDNWLKMILMSSGYIFVYIITVYCFLLTSNEKTTIKKILHKEK